MPITIQKTTFERREFDVTNTCQFVCGCCATQNLFLEEEEILLSSKNVCVRTVLDLRSFVCLFGEGTHARSVVAEASGMAQKTVTRTSFEATRDLARPDNTFI